MFFPTFKIPTIAEKTLYIIISSSQNNINLRTLANAAGYGGSGSCIFTINSGVTIGSSSSSVAAVTRGSFNSGTRVKLINRGAINGGTGTDGQPSSVDDGIPGIPGGRGGTALDSSAGALTLVNQGSIIGGGGGPGAGGSAHTTYIVTLGETFFYAGVDVSGGYGDNVGGTTWGTAPDLYAFGGTSGSRGTPGVAGTSGTDGSSNTPIGGGAPPWATHGHGSAGGAVGYSIVGYSYVIIDTYGTITGATSP
jgi:hypothetical protein